MLIDTIPYDDMWKGVLRSAFPIAVILISGGFFAAAAGKGITRPAKGIILFIHWFICFSLVPGGIRYRAGFIVYRIWHDYFQ
ncbi:MAG TPA: hypothetical protein VN721_00075 [Flavipsychrobacter sp.]|nr:hypothetical protein [Flavipsychrobacter sp.]